MSLFADADQDIYVSSLAVSEGSAGHLLEQLRNITRLIGAGKGSNCLAVNTDTNTVVRTGNQAEVSAFVDNNVRSNQTQK